jgi:N-acetylglucosamine kinase-like BadF-type ATPase
MGYILGIDGGGTKTTCVLATDEGVVLARAVSGPGNYLKVGVDVVKESFRTAIHAVCRQAGVNPPRIDAVCAGLAGAERPRDRKTLRGAFQEIVSAKKIFLETDAYITLIAATEGKPGLIVIAGTGSVAMGMNAQGERARAGGWGHIIGDEGSGYDIGRKAMVTALHSYDGRIKKTILEERILQALTLRKMEDLISLVYSGKISPDKIAALYPVVINAAQQGDAAAIDLLRQAGRELGKIATAVIGRLHMQRARLALAISGGVFKAGGVLLTSFTQTVRRVARRAEIIAPRHPPEIGAVALALWRLKGFQVSGFKFQV